MSKEILDIETRLLNLSLEELEHLPVLSVNLCPNFANYHIRFEKWVGQLGFRFVDFPAHAGWFFLFLPGSLSIPKRGPFFDGNYLKWVGTKLRFYVVQENFEMLFQVLDQRLKPGFRQFLLAGYGRLNATRDLPRQTRLYKRRNNSIRRFLDHPMFECQLLPVIRDFVY